MNIVKEILHFQKGNDPRYGLNLGKRNMIEKWLEKYKVENYTISDDFNILSKQSVDLSSKDIYELPYYIKFDKIDGGFYCSHCKLESFKGMPKLISGAFICNDNWIENLEKARLYFEKLEEFEQCKKCRDLKRKIAQTKLATLQEL
jgi:hypothetical protein